MDSAVGDVFFLFVRLGLLAVGGGTALLGEMQRESLARGWLSQDQFIEAYAIGQITPGPGTLFVVPIGYQAAGIPGALAAAVGFVLPTAALALVAIHLWSRLRTSPWPSAIRDALLPVAIGLSFASAYTMGRTLSSPASFLIAGVALAALARTRVPTPLVLVACGTAGSAIAVMGGVL